jgi:hypothetical protein
VAIQRGVAVDGVVVKWEDRDDDFNVPINTIGGRD